MTDRVVTHKVTEENKDMAEDQRRETHRVRDRSDVANISAFQGLGSEDLFYYEVSRESTPERPTLLARRSPCYDKCCMGSYLSALFCPMSKHSVCVLMDKERRRDAQARQRTIEDQPLLRINWGQQRRDGYDTDACCCEDCYNMDGAKDITDRDTRRSNIGDCTHLHVTRYGNGKICQKCLD